MKKIITLKYLFTPAQLYTAGNSDGNSRGIWEGNLSYASTFMQQFSSTSGLWYGDKYVFNNDYLSAIWLTRFDGSAADYYAAGVVQPVLQLKQAGAGIAESDAEVYLAGNPWLAADGLRQIDEQYWLATFCDCLEARSNWKKSGYPELVPVNDEANIANGSIPRRFTYPMDEARVNPDNFSTAVNSNNGGDKITSRVWWDSE